jgi:hypothetical protein
MKIIDNKIDRSVKCRTNCLNGRKPARIVPTVPISKAEELKAGLIKQLSKEYSCVQPRLIHQAVNEAHALAALTVAPLLFLPALAEEKAQNAADWTVRQRAMLQPQTLAFAA